MDSVFLKYKGRPLVRCNNQIFYGDPSNSRVILIYIDSSASKFSVGLVSTLAAFNGNIFKPFKYSVKESLFEAIDLAAAWMDRV